ncbi:glycoside hydrolase family 88 protein [Lactiplantibacillus pentosus]|uniref:glycoside hydrolase family 88 protein n=1 Tax=Lactiplantibacillus pentosus TaxID=1589 RepID=UPI0021824D01|nr:glycoside hydrolase family 88 protein [Lactiplantibacillus pentosus]MCS8604503.1 glycosyl hydrolase family 88 [Lactiplantibacillus pentosus]
MKENLSSEETIKFQSIWQSVQKKLAVTSTRIGSRMPYIAINHRYKDFGGQHLNWWTNGFWGGIQWQLYHATNTKVYLANARAIETKLDTALSDFDKLDHDVGFIWLNTAVADYQITKNPDALTRGIKAADVLSARYNSVGQYLTAWNGVDKQGQVIVDCFMNLSLLYWASQQTGDQHYAQIANCHANTAMNALVRPDGSVNHIAVFDAKTGRFIHNLGGQGYGLESAWARGQAWAIYGLALVYKNNHDSKYLEKAKSVADFFIANVALNDFVSVIDFRAPAEPKYYDTTATAIAICGMLELTNCLPALEGRMYRCAAKKMFLALSEDYVNFNEADDELLIKGSAKYSRKDDREVPIIYGDAFYLEALLRLLNLNLRIY